jgi:hypothetical protein
MTALITWRDDTLSLHDDFEFVPGLLVGQVACGSRCSTGNGTCVILNPN